MAKQMTNNIKKREKRQETPKLLKETTEAKKIISIAIIALMGSVIAYILTAKFALLFYKPDVELALEKAKNVVAVGGYQPEPVEAFLFRLGMLTIPLFLLSFIWALTKTKLSEIEWGKHFNILSTLFILIGVASIYFGLAANNPNYVENAQGNNFANSRDLTYPSNFGFFFAESFLGQHLGVYICVVIPVLLGLLYLIKRFPNVFESRFSRKFGLILTIGYALFYLLVVYQIFQFSFPYTWENKYDFNVIYYPSLQVFAGIPLLVDGFVTGYGAYAHFLNPIFKIIGLDVSTFTAVMSTLNVLILALTLIAMLRTIKSRLLVILGFSSITFLCVLLHRIVIPFDAMFAIYPVRHLMPAIALCMASFYFFNKNRILYFTTFILLGFGILWNPEFGMVAFVAWVAALSYSEFSANKIQTIAINIVKHGLVALGSILLCFGIFAITIYLRFGSMPDFMSMFNIMVYFGGLGVGMLPMVLVHPWNFIILIYIVGLAYSIYALFEKSLLTPKTVYIFLLSIMGIGVFTYFQGRSHNWNFIFIISNALILVAIYADILFEKIKKQGLSLPYGLALTLLIAVLGFSCLDLVLHQDKLNKLDKQSAERLANFEEQRQIEDNIAFIKQRIPETTEKIYIHTSNKYQALYFGGCLKKSAFNPSIIDIYTRENCNRLKNQMLSDSSDVFIEAPNFYYGYVQNTNAAMCATRSVNADNGRMSYLKRRTYSTLTKPVLQETSKDVLLYEKFTDDTASLNKRVDYAMQGKPAITWNSRYSIEVVFYAEKQVYHAAAVFSNCTDSTGIELLNGNRGDYYMLRWGQDRGVGLSLQQNRWHYLVMQTDGQMMNIFLNGQQLNSSRLDKPIEPASMKNFFIGNKDGGQQHFTGVISEILIKNGYSSLDEIRKRQQQLEN